MIGKVKAVSDFRRTISYVCEDRDPSAILIYSNNISHPVEVENGESSNSSSHYARMMEDVASLSKRVRKPCYHISLSPSHLDKLTKLEWSEFCEAFVAEVGLQENQAIAYLHQDVFYLDGSTRAHAHLVVNRVNAESGLAAPTSWNYRRFESAIRKLEKCFELRPLESSFVKRHKFLDMDQSTYTQTIRDSVAKALASTESLSDFEDALSGYGVGVKHYTFPGQPQSSGWGFYIPSDSGVDSRVIPGHKLGERYSKPKVTAYFQLKNSQTSPIDPPSQGIGSVLAVTSSAPVDQNEAGLEDGFLERDEDLPEYLNRSRNVLIDFSRSTSSLSGDLDGGNIASAALTGAAGVVTVAEHFFRQMQKAKESSLDDRLFNLIERLEDVGERTSKLEDHFTQSHSFNKETFDADEGQTEAFDLRSLPEYSQESPSGGVLDDPWETVVEDRANDPLVSAVEISHDRLNRLAQNTDSSLRRSMDLGSERQASLEERMALLEDAVTRLEKRLDGLEEYIFGANSPEPVVKPNQEDIAESLFNYSNSWASFYDRSQSEINIRTTRGDISLTNEEDGVSSIVVKDASYGEIFTGVRVASETGHSWSIDVNELSEDTALRFIKLPQSESEYVASANAKLIISGLDERFSDRYPKRVADPDFEMDILGGERTLHFSISRELDGVHYTATHEDSLVLDAFRNQDSSVQTKFSSFTNEEVANIDAHIRLAKEHRRPRQHREMQKELSL